MPDVICRRCLLSESQQGEALYHSIIEYIEAIPHDYKTPQNEYHRRLEICKSCNQLTNGMCALCGCFVEARAAKVNQHCVKNDW